ncbi:MAG: imelysin family protein [Deltaproteobacteria bacterium]
MESLRASSLTALLATFVFACGGDDDAAANTSSLPANASEAVSTYADIVYASYRDASSGAQSISTAAAALVSSPSAATQSTVQRAWLDAREPYLQTEVYRFYGGPIDDDDGPEVFINAWPLDEGHIDYVEGDPDTGIINDTSRALTPANLMAANQVPGETNVATGYHAIEFLLWGQDLNPSGPGQRPFGDYAANAPAGNGERRGIYLSTTSTMLVGHLQQLVDAWTPDRAGNYRATLESKPPAEALGLILSGMIILSGFELANERLSAALDAQDQEEEHSCFSDNTHRDMVQDVRGIQNVWLGNYAPVQGAAISGTGVQDVVAAADAALASDITAQIAQSLRLAEALQPPFDREIAPGNAAGNARVDALIESLSDQEDLLERAFSLFGLNRIPDPA